MDEKQGTLQDKRNWIWVLVLGGVVGCGRRKYLVHEVHVLQAAEVVVDQAQHLRADKGKRRRRKGKEKRVGRWEKGERRKGKE